MKPYPEQVTMANEVRAVLKQYGLAYLAAEERTGKTLAAILVAESLNINTIQVITKKNALGGWNETLAAYEHMKDFRVTNYHQAKKCEPADMLILDEAHNYISGYPKRSAIWRDIKRISPNAIILYTSATPNAQGYQMLFNQFALSSYSPWRKYANFYKWFKDYGKPYSIEINQLDIAQYDRCKDDKVLEDVKHLFVTKTRAELGFDYEPEDKLHYVELNQITKDVYNEIIEHKVVELKAGWLVCDTGPKLRYALHMLEGGVAKIDDQYIVLANNEKIDYILKHFGDHDGLVIMYNYKAELLKLEGAFKKARLLQATSFAEGVDLHKYSDLIIYSQDFSTARHTQRRARQANKKRDTPIIVHYLLVRKAISSGVYKTVSINKKNFVDSTFERHKL